MIAGMIFRIQKWRECSMSEIVTKFYDTYKIGKNFRYSYSLRVYVEELSKFNLHSVKFGDEYDSIETTNIKIKFFEQRFYPDDADSSEHMYVGFIAYDEKKIKILYPARFNSDTDSIFFFFKNTQDVNWYFDTVDTTYLKIVLYEFVKKLTNSFYQMAEPKETNLILKLDLDVVNEKYKQNFSTRTLIHPYGYTMLDFLMEDFSLKIFELSDYETLTPQRMTINEF